MWSLIIHWRLKFPVFFNVPAYQINSLHVGSRGYDSIDIYGQTPL
jgi:hypothetical protein